MLSKKVAAEFLGVCPRSLERYTRDGRISARYERGRARKTPVYDETDLAALKAELEETAPARPKPVMAATVADPVGFRLAAEYLNRLDEEGAKRGMGRNAYARLLVVDALERGEFLRIREDMSELRSLLRLLGEDMASAAFALLLHAGHIGDEAEAREWVRANLKAKEI